MSLSNGSTPFWGVPILYLHEINQVRPGRLNAFLQAVELDYLPIAERLGIRMVGYWTVPPGHGSWPETVAVWELDGYEHHVDVTRARLDPSRYDEGLRDWDANVGEWVTRSEGMVCLPSSMTPTVAQIEERGLKAKMCTHELIHNEPGRQEEYLRIVEEFYFKRVASVAGRSIVGESDAKPNWATCMPRTRWRAIAATTAPGTVPRSSPTTRHRYRCDARETKAHSSSAG